MGRRNPAGASGVPRTAAAGGEDAAQLAGLGRAGRHGRDCRRFSGICYDTDTLGCAASYADGRTNTTTANTPTGPDGSGRTRSEDRDAADAGR